MGNGPRPGQERPPLLIWSSSPALGRPACDGLGGAGGGDHRLAHPGEGRATATGNRLAGTVERRSGCRPSGALPEGITEERFDVIGVKGVLFPLLAGLCWAVFLCKLHDLRLVS